MLISFRKAKYFDFDTQCVSCGRKRESHKLCRINEGHNIGVYLQAPINVETYFWCYLCWIIEETNIEIVKRMQKITGLELTEKGKTLLNVD